MDEIAEQMTGVASTAKGRVCFLTSNFPRWPGDSTTPFVLHLAQDMAREGWSVDVLAPHAPEAAREETLGAIRVYRFRYFWPERKQTLCYQGGALINLRRSLLARLQVPALVLAEAVAMWRLARRRKYDLLHAHWILPQGFVAVLVGWLVRTPTIVTIHGGDIFALKGRFLTALKRFALDHARAVTANSSETLKRARQIMRGPMAPCRIYMGATDPGSPNPDAVDAIKKRFMTDDPLTLIFTGRLVEEKGVGDLVAAMKLLKASALRIQLLVLGEGQDRPTFERQVERLGLSGSVRFLGWVAPEVVPDYLAAADIFVAPSKTEGQGLAIVEALLAGIPVVATRCGGIPDVVEDGVGGILVDEGRPDEIAAAIGKLANNPGLRRRLAEAGRAHARAHFTRAKSAAAFSQLYSSVLRLERAVRGVA